MDQPPADLKLGIDAEAREKRLASEKARWDKRLDDLRKAIRCAQIMGCDKVRVFAGSRVEDPKTMYSRIAETIGGTCSMSPVSGAAAARAS